MRQPKKTHRLRRRRWWYRFRPCTAKDAPRAAASSARPAAPQDACSDGRIRFTRREAAISRSPADAASDDRAPASDDQEVVARISAGEVAAFEELYRRHTSALLGYAYGQLQSRELAEDVVQELFLALWQQRAKWDLRRSLRSYLFGALRNRIVSHRRSFQAREGRLRRVEDPDHGLDALPGASRTDHSVREAELSAAIERAVEALSPRCRETFLLVRQQHLSYAEAAEVLGISVKGVEMNMMRALAALRRQLGPWCD